MDRGTRARRVDLQGSLPLSSCTAHMQVQTAEQPRDGPVPTTTCKPLGWVWFFSLMFLFLFFFSEKTFVDFKQ